MRKTKCSFSCLESTATARLCEHRFRCTTCSLLGTVAWEPHSCNCLCGGQNRTRRGDVLYNTAHKAGRRRSKSQTSKEGTAPPAAVHRPLPSPRLVPAMTPTPSLPSEKAKRVSFDLGRNEFTQYDRTDPPNYPTFAGGEFLTSDGAEILDIDDETRRNEEILAEWESSFDELGDRSRARRRSVRNSSVVSPRVVHVGLENQARIHSLLLQAREHLHQCCAKSSVQRKS